MKNFGRLLLIVALIWSISHPYCAQAATTLWWDTSYISRFEIAVATGAVTPDKGYIDYTARIPALDTQALIAAGQMRTDCADLRILYYDGLVWTELPRHVIGCNTTTTDIRFALAANIAASSTDDNYYLYHNNPTPAALPAFTETNVYLWYDDASIDRSASYARGRTDPWHGGGWDNSLVWNAAGYYTYNTGDNFTSGYRRAVDERDVYAEAEWYHTGCYQLNITTGIIVRGIISGGSGGSESSNHYYASNRGEYPGCSTNGYSHDADIVKNQRTTTAVNGPNPPDLIASQWRRQGLASWSINPTALSYWDEDNSTAWAALGFPSAANLQVAGTDATDNEGRGFAGFMTAQDVARIRNIVIRRYVDPEPVLTLTAQPLLPDLVLQKTSLTVSDPYNGAILPKAIPGANIDYTLVATNNGPGPVDSASLIVIDPLPATASLFVNDLAGAGTGPVEFIDGSGAAVSGLSYTFTSLASTTDDIDFSTDGISYAYVPVADAEGFDPMVRFVRVNPAGSFGGLNGTTARTFSLRLRIRIE